MFVVLWGALWVPLIPAVLCMVLVRGKRLAALGLSVAWLLINTFVFWMGAVHCYYGCVDEPWYVLWSVVATISIGVFLLVLFSGWIVRWNAKRAH